MRLTTIACVALLAMLQASCGGDDGNGPVAAKIAVAPDTATIRIGQSAAFVATPVDAKGNVIGVNGQIAWTTSAPTVATVDNTGKVTGVGAGTADVIASVDKISGSAKVTVLRVPVARMDVTPTSVSFNRSQTRQLTASLFAADNSVLTDRTITWTTSSATVVTVSPTSGASVTLTAVAPGPATVTATSEGVTRDVAVTVQPDPVITFTPTAGALGSTAGGGNPAPQTITVSNSGGGTLSGLTAGTVSFTTGQPAGWLTAAFEGTTTAPAPLTLRATTGALAIGTYTASVPVSSSVAGVVAKNLAVSFTIGSAIALGATPPNVSFTAPPVTGNPVAQTVTVSSVNGTVIPSLALSPIEYTAGQPTGWLVAALSGTSTPSTLTLNATVGSLASGTYTANVPITAATATNSPLKIPVTFVVPAPLIALSPTAMSFVATQSIGTATGQTVTISNGGRGALNNLQVSVSYTGGPTNWLSANLSSTTAPATLTLTPVANSISRGTYSATVQVSAAGVANSPQNITVSYTLVLTFAQHIAGTLATTCTAGGCHTAAPRVIFTGTPATVYARVVPALATAGNLGSTLYVRTSSTTSPMPPSGVIPAVRDAIRDWILDGVRP